MKFLNNWIEPLPRIAERHQVLSIFSDASDFKWWVSFLNNGHSPTFSKGFAHYDKGSTGPVERYYNLYLGKKLRNSRILARVDNKALVFAWNNQNGKNDELNQILKDVFQLTFNSNNNLSVSYVHTSENPANEPS